METTKTLKHGALIKGIDFSSSFYERLSALFMEFAALSTEDPGEYKYHLETLAILMATLDEAAENQGLTEDSEIKDSPV